MNFLYHANYPIFTLYLIIKLFIQMSNKTKTDYFPIIFLPALVGVIILLSPHTSFNQAWQIQLYQPQMEQIRSSSLRNLQQSTQNASQQAQAEKPKPSNLNPQTQAFFKIIVIVSISLLVLGLLCCIGCIVKVIYNIERRSYRLKVGNEHNQQEFCYGRYCEAVSYGVFEGVVGTGFQDSCVVCLETFGGGFDQTEEVNQHIQIVDQCCSPSLQNMPSNIIYISKSSQRKPKCPQPIKITTQFQKPINKLQTMQHQYQQPDPSIQLQKQQIEQQQQLKQQQLQQQAQQAHQKQTQQQPPQENQSKQQLVKLTVCGHLFHAKCLDQWLEREQNCPTCRQGLDLHNILNWETRLNIDILGQQRPTLQGTKYRHPNPDFVRNNSTTISMQNNYTQQPQLEHDFINNFNQTMNSIGKPKDKNNNQQIQLNQINDNQNLPKQLQKYNLTQSQKKWIIIYSKIMSYHRKLQPQFPNTPQALIFQQVSPQNVRTPCTPHHQQQLLHRTPMTQLAQDQSNPWEENIIQKNTQHVSKTFNLRSRIRNRERNLCGNIGANNVVGSVSVSGYGAFNRAHDRIFSSASIQPNQK